jgi:molybdenum cofactor biosynthesis protein B
VKPHEGHRKAGKHRLRVRIVTLSTSRYSMKKGGKEYTDEAGDVAVAEVTKAGHEVTDRKLISDDATMLRREVRAFLAGKDDVLLLTGGTGVSIRDITIETVRPFFEKELPGFGELLRRVSYDEIGSAAMLTRATAGVARGKLLVCMPGSPGAVKTALGAALPEFPHALFVARS